MMESIAVASTRFAHYPASVIYNAAIAAYSSYHTATYMNENPSATFQSILNNSWTQGIKIGTNYSNLDLVQMFPTLVTAPYTGRVLAAAGSETTGRYGLFDAPLSSSDTGNTLLQKIQEAINKIESPKYYGLFKIQITFVLGEPQAIFVER